MKLTSSLPALRPPPPPLSRPPLPAPPAARLASSHSSFEPAPASAPPAAALLGLSRGAARPPALIKQLQDTLIARGFLDPSVVSNAGYGNTFGRLTEAAVKKLQAAEGIPASGRIDQATAAALAPRPPAAPIIPTTTYPGAPAGDPNAASLVGLQQGGGTPAQVKQLQDDLLRMGYVDASFTQNGGYGRQFGPKTEAAVRSFQQDNGLPLTGVIDEATAQALAAPRPRPAPIAAAAALANREQLGLPTSAAQLSPDGTVRQNFEHGSIEATPDGVLYLRTPAGEDLVPPQQVGAAGSIAEANANFLSQWGPTDWNSAGGAPYGYNDCGPTSAAMALSALGVIPHPSPGEASQTIDSIRDKALGYDSNTSQTMGNAQLIAAIEASGAQGAEVKPLTAEAIDAALAAGHPMILGSTTTWAAWGQTQQAAGDYLNGQNPGGHFVTLMGKAPNGNYLVADPLSKTGVIEVSPEQLQRALSGSWGGVEVSRT